MTTKIETAENYKIQLVIEIDATGTDDDALIMAGETIRFVKLTTLRNARVADMSIFRRMLTGRGKGLYQRKRINVDRIPIREM